MNEAIEALRRGEVTLEHVLELVDAKLEGQADWVPDAIVEALGARHAVSGGLANGGADQVVWNDGAVEARRYAAAFRAVGAIENADLFVRLADELDAFLEEEGVADDDPVRSFLAYRRRVRGPFFGGPSLDEELAEALVEYAMEHAVPDPASGAQ